MKRETVAFVVIFCIAILIVSVAYADKPDKPGRNKAECIKFTGDLESVPEGGTVVEGCCPNAGPNPAYSMKLNLTDAKFLSVTRDGYVFMNSYGRNAPYEGYKIQFSTWDDEERDPGTGDYFFEIRGGVMDGGKKKDNRPFTVTFSNATATAWVFYKVLDPSCYPPDCDDPDCDPYPCEIAEFPCDPDCSGPLCDTCWIVDGPCHPCCDSYFDPCVIEIGIPNVNFVLLRDSDLSNCE
jgi:hypothetical protein